VGYIDPGEEEGERERRKEEREKEKKMSSVKQYKLLISLNCSPRAHLVLCVDLGRPPALCFPPLGTMAMCRKGLCMVV
jgi:hypothetical protein